MEVKDELQFVCGNNEMSNKYDHISETFASINVHARIIIRDAKRKGIVAY